MKNHILNKQILYLLYLLNNCIYYLYLILSFKLIEYIEKKLNKYYN